MKIIVSPRRHRYLARVSILLVTVAVIAATIGCGLDPVFKPPPQYNLTITSTAGGSVIQPGEGAYTYEQGTVVQLVAEAADGCQFDRWSGDVQTVASIWAASTTITMNSIYTVTAGFARQIRDWNDLRAIDDNPGFRYVLMNDLNSGTAGYDELAGQDANWGEGWQPIGNWTDSFSGSFDGQGYEIGDLFIDRPEENYVGLFGAVGEAGMIRNLKAKNAAVTGSEDVGALAGWNGGAISNCHSTGIVTGGLVVGGLVGRNHQGSLSGCSSGADVGLGLWVGGLVGYNYRGTVSNSYSAGSVSGQLRVGGLVGYNDKGNVLNCHSLGYVEGYNQVGGLVGDNWGGIVSRSYAAGSVTGRDGIGGLIGENWDGTVSDSYATGSVDGRNEVGGLMGWSDGEVGRCYATGSVTGSNDVGGLVGWNDGAVGNCFWDIETSGTDQSDGGVGKTTAEMKNIATFSDAGWNIVAVAPDNNDTAYTWNIVNGETYPFLSWQ
jgi:hypothetical protein